MAITPTSNFARVIVVGAGGFAREVLHWARDAWPDCGRRMAGFLSSEPRPVAPHSHDLAVLGDPETFVPQPGDAFLLAIGIPGVRRKVAESLEARGATLLTLVHPTAVVASTASIGGGSILCPFSIVSDSARIGRCTLMNYHSSLGHDAATGDFVVLSPYATLGGGAHVDDDVFLGLHASVGPSKRIGPRSKVSANSVALSDAPADSLVYGVPGRVQPFVSGAAC